MGQIKIIIAARLGRIYSQTSWIAIDIEYDVVVVVIIIIIIVIIM